MAPSPVEPVSGTVVYVPLRPVVENERWTWLASMLLVVAEPGKMTKSTRVFETRFAEGLAATIVKVVVGPPASSVVA
jgi:hypothetical protein